LVILLAIAGLGSAGTAHADHRPVIAVPGRPEVPVVIDGQNASWAVVIGDWGLYRPGHLAPIIIRRRPWAAPPRYRRAAVVARSRYRRARRCHCKPVKIVRRPAAARAATRHYFPGGTTPPQLGRLESPAPISPPPKPADSFSRSWSAGSAPLPATIDPSPPVVVAPIIDNRFRPKPKPPKP
jgi:hypothetical protein